MRRVLVVIAAVGLVAVALLVPVASAGIPYDPWQPGYLPNWEDGPSSVPQGWASGATGGQMSFPIEGTQLGFQDAMTGAGASTLIEDSFFSQISGVATDATYAMAADSPGFLSLAMAGLSFVVPPVAIGYLAGTALTLGASVITKHFHAGSTAHNYYATYSADQLGVYSGICTEGISAYGTLGGGSLFASSESGNFWTHSGCSSPGSTNVFLDAPAAFYHDCLALSSANATANAAMITSIHARPGTEQTGTGSETCQSGATNGYTLGQVVSGLTFFEKWMTPAQYSAAFTVSAAPWTGQTVDGTIGVPVNSTGAGEQPQGTDAPVNVATSIASADPTPLVVCDGVRYTVSDALTHCDLAGAGFVPPGMALANTATRNYVNCTIDPVDYTCPTIAGGVFTTSGGATASTYAVPDCTGLTPAACIAAINTAADGARIDRPSVTELVLSQDGAVVTQPAGAVVATDPAGGAVITPSTGSAVTLTENPSVLPLVLPAPGVNETEADYEAQLVALGWTGTATVTVLSTADDAVGPNAVSRIGIADPDTGDVTYYTPNTWPGVPPRIVPGQAVTIYENTPDAIPATGSPTSGTSGCGCPALDFTPLTSLNPGSVFPFGIYSWVAGGVVGTDATAPSFDWPEYFGGGTQTSHVDLASWDPVVTILRALLVFGATVGVVWGLAHRLQGWGVPPE